MSYVEGNVHALGSSKRLSKRIQFWIAYFKWQWRRTLTTAPTILLWRRRQCDRKTRMTQSPNLVHTFELQRVSTVRFEFSILESILMVRPLPTKTLISLPTNHKNTPTSADNQGTLCRLPDGNARGVMHSHEHHVHQSARSSACVHCVLVPASTSAANHAAFVTVCVYVCVDNTISSNRRWCIALLRQLRTGYVYPRTTLNTNPFHVYSPTKQSTVCTPKRVRIVVRHTNAVQNDPVTSKTICQSVLNFAFHLSTRCSASC